MCKQEKIIGRLNEHTLHLALKNYFEPDRQYHEQEYEGFVADIKKGSDIVEIETSSFTNIKKKLGKFLKSCSVTVVYPIVSGKWIVWINPESGDLSPKRKSPKKGKPSDVCYELYKLKPFIKNANFHLKLVKVELTEYKMRNGWSSDGKRGAERVERIPEAIKGVIDIDSLCEYEKLADIIPEGEFTSSIFAKLNHMSGRYAWYLIDILLFTDVIERTGMRGRAYLYRRK